MSEKGSVSGKMHIFDLIDDVARNLIRHEALCALKNYFGLDSCASSNDSKLDDLRLGAFVTLKDQSGLRGCIGFISPEKGLLQTVRDAAILAATEDPRFLPVNPYEIDDLEIDVTVLGEVVPLNLSEEDALKSIVIGRHGLMAKSKFGKGLLLPQVAIEWNFTCLEFVEATCLKAGLNKEDWKKPDVSFYMFEGVDF